MEANELRIENLVYWAVFNRTLQVPERNGDAYAVTASDIKRFNSGKIWLLPISLTEDWLLKLGFEKHHGEFTNERGDSCFTVEYFDYTKSYHFTGGEGVRFGNGCKYVHQLQNLYHSMMGEELQIREPWTMIPGSLRAAGEFPSAKELQEQTTNIERLNSIIGKCRAKTDYGDLGNMLVGSGYPTITLEYLEDLENRTNAILLISSKERQNYLKELHEKLLTGKVSFEEYLKEYQIPYPRSF